MVRHKRNQPDLWGLLRAVIVGSCILALVAGCGSAAQASQADLEARRADVRYRPQVGAEELVQAGVTRKAGKGDAVNVEQQGEAALHFADGLDVRIFHDSRVTLTSEVNPNAAPIYRYRMEAGTTFNTVSAQAAAAGRVVVVETQWAVITDTGTAFLVYVDPVRATTWTVVTSGTVAISGGGVVVTVPAGSQSVVEPGKPPEPPTPATRAALGNRFPTVDALTNNVLQETQVLASPAVAGAPSASATVPPTAPPTATPEPTVPPTVPAAIGKDTNITGEGQVGASSIFSADFAAALGVDGDRGTSWFSAGPNPNGSPTTFQWTGTRDDMIVSVFVPGNGDHSNRSFRTGYGFGSVTVQVLDTAGKVLFEQVVALAGTPDPDVQVHPNVAGRAVLLLFSGSEASDCGGFSELEVTALR